MKLAEALAIRAELSTRIQQLTGRLQANARYQEGAEPAESAIELLAAADQAFTDLQSLIARINRTNSTAMVEGYGTVTDAIARRDVLRMRLALWNKTADAATAEQGFGGFRQLRSELRVLSALSVRELRATVDDLARQHREVDTAIQRANWEVDLIG